MIVAENFNNWKYCSERGETSNYLLAKGENPQCNCEHCRWKKGDDFAAERDL